MGCRLAVAAVVVLAGCGDGGSKGGVVSDDPDAAGAIDGAAPDATPGIPFADRSWGELELLDLGRHPQVAIDAHGNVMTLWEWEGPSPDFESRCFTRRRVFDTSSWEPEHDLVTPEAVSGGLEKPEGTTVGRTEDICTGKALGTDASGRAAVVFIHNRSIQGGTDFGLWWSAMRATFDPDSGWSEPEWAGQNAPCCAIYGLTMSAQGTAALGWSDDGQLWAAAYRPDGGWEDALLVTDTRPDSAILDEFVLDDHGDGLAVFHIPGRLLAARLQDGDWQPPVPLDDADFPATLSSRDIAMNGEGGALMVWRRCPSADLCEIRARHFDPVSGWAGPVTVAPIGDLDGAFDQEMQVAIDARGNGLLVWVESWPDPEGTQHPDTGELLRFNEVNVARFRDGAWRDAESLHAGELGDGRRYPRVALDDAGNGLVAWWWWRYWYQDASWDPHSEFAVQTYTPDDGFGARETLELLIPSTSGTPPDLAMNPSGVGVAVWGRNDQGRVRIFR